LLAGVGIPVALIIGAVSCNRQTASLPPPSAVRIAIFPIENLSGHPEWLGNTRALPLLIDYQLSGLKDVAPVLVGSASDAAAQHAARELRGYLESVGSKLSLRLQDRASAGKIERVLDAQGASLREISQNIASRISSQAAKLPEANDEALNAFAAGLGALGTPEAINHFIRTTQLAPAFGPAWLQLGSALWSAGQASEAVQAWQAALARGPLLDAISRARIRAELAARTQSPDLPAALAELARLLPADAGAQHRAGEALANAGQFPEAVRLLRAAVAADPANGAYRNLLAYSQALARDFDGALATIGVYQQIEPKNPNPIDSKGEIQFLARRFADAGRTFESAYGADPTFAQGFTMRKAAEAYLLAGDTASADRVMAAWTQTVPANSSIRERFLAVWEHRTGKRKEAIERLIRVGPSDGAALAQAIVWLTQDGDRSRAAALASQIPGPSGLLLRFITQPSASGQVWNDRAATTFPDPRQAAARRTSLTFALALDKRWADVAAIIAPAQSTMSLLQSGQVLALYRRALAETGRTEELNKLPDFPMLPTPGADGLFDSLIYVK